MLGGVYLLMAVMLVLGTLMSRREPFARLLTASLAWIAIFAGGFVVFTYDAGEEIRIPMAIDGHFWVDAQINGEDVKVLVDSGATMTTVGRETAARVGMQISPGRNQVVRTGNGLVRVATGTANTLTVGSIERDNVPVHVANDEDLNVLGMNFLSSLQRWGVEGRWLILVP